MKILHTSDLHLKKPGDERWRALLLILELAGKESADAVCISGDLFDADADAGRLKPEIREVFSRGLFKVLVIPGNHDSGISPGEFFGEDVHIFDSTEIPVKAGDIRFWGVPFSPAGREGALKAVGVLRKNLSPDATNIVLFHGELADSFFRREDFGEEGAGRYMPVRLSDFRGVRADYVLAGHFHTNFSVRRIENCRFVYPGSPVSVTRREAGRRKVNLFETGSEPRGVHLGSFHYDRRVIRFGPFDEESPVERLEKSASEALPGSRLVFSLSGCFNGAKFGIDEAALAGKVRQLEEAGCEFERPLEFRDMQKIADDELFRLFEARLGERKLSAREKERVWELGVSAMAEEGS